MIKELEVGVMYDFAYNVQFQSFTYAGTDPEDENTRKGIVYVERHKEMSCVL